MSKLILMKTDAASEIQEIPLNINVEQESATNGERKWKKYIMN